MGNWILFLFGIMALLFAWFFMTTFKQWMISMVSGVPIGMLCIFKMRVRKMDSELLVNQYIISQKAGLSVTLEQLQMLYLAGGKVANVVIALIAAEKENMALDFQTAANLDFEGRDILEMVNKTVRANSSQLIVE